MSTVTWPDGQSKTWSSTQKCLCYTCRQLFGGGCSRPLGRLRIETSFEIRLMPMKDTQTGRVMMRRRHLKSYTDTRRRNLLLVVDVRKEVLEGWTLVKAKQTSYLQGQRKGIFLYGD